MRDCKTLTPIQEGGFQSEFLVPQNRRFKSTLRPLPSPVFEIYSIFLRCMNYSIIVFSCRPQATAALGTAVSFLFSFPPSFTPSFTPMCAKNVSYISTACAQHYLALHSIAQHYYCLVLALLSICNDQHYHCLPWHYIIQFEVLGGAKNC